LAVVGAFLWIEQIFSLNWLRLYTVPLPGILLFTWLVGMKSRTRPYVLGAMWLVVIGTAVQRVWITQHMIMPPFNCPRASASSTARNTRR
jgi:hypothetical protein